jgi:VanZ like family
LSGAPRTERAVGAVLLGAALLAIAAITLTPVAGDARLPFWCWRCGARPGVDLLLNVLLFVPLGIALGLRRLPGVRVLLACLALTSTIELLQLAVVPGRFGTARDIAANTAGGMLGWWLGFHWRALAMPTARRATRLAVSVAAVWVAGEAFTAWAVAPMLPPLPWWAQLRPRDLSFPATFRGNLVSLRVAEEPLPYSDQLEPAVGDRVRRSLGAGAAMSATITDVRPSPAAAPIALVATDDRLGEIAGLVLDGTDVVFRLRTRAAWIGLRNPALRLRGALAADRAADTVTVAGRVERRRYHVAAMHAGARSELAVAASASWGWVLLMPIPHYAFGAEVRSLTALWVALPLLLVGYWAARGVAAEGGNVEVGEARRRTVVVAFAHLGLPVLLSLAAAPIAFGLPVAHWSEWLGAASGAAAGWRFGRAGRR